MGLLAETMGQIWIAQQAVQCMTERIEIRWVADQQTVDAIFDLVSDSAHGACQDGPAFPHCLGNCKPKALPKTLLHYGRSMTLNCVHDGGVFLNIRGGQMDQLDPAAAVMR